jgi:hypothetical protein
MFHQRSLRRFAATVLFVWLFGIASGIVNACIVSGELGRGAALAESVEHDHSAMTAAEAETMEHGSVAHDDGAKSGSPACERLCEAPPAAPQAEKLGGNLLSAFWLAVAPPPTMVVQAVPRSSTPPPRADHAWSAAIPISIAFLRLAL